MAAMGGSLGLLLDGDWVRKHPFLAERLHSCKTNGWRAEIQARAAMVGNEIETRAREQIQPATLARTELPEAMRPGAAWASSTSTVDYDYDEVDYDYEQPPPPPPRPEQNLRSDSEWSSRWGGRETGAEESQLPSPKRPRLHDASSESAATGITGHIAAEQFLASLDPGRDGSPPDVGRPERDSNGAVQQQLLEVQQEVHQRLREALSRQQQIQMKQEQQQHATAALDHYQDRYQQIRQAQGQPQPGSADSGSNSAVTEQLRQVRKIQEELRMQQERQQQQPQPPPPVAKQGESSQQWPQQLQQQLQQLQKQQRDHRQHQHQQQQQQQQQHQQHQHHHQHDQQQYQQHHYQHYHQQSYHVQQQQQQQQHYQPQHYQQQQQCRSAGEPHGSSSSPTTNRKVFVGTYD